MSWMDSWSRPNKSSATPPPLYLTRDDVKYCSTCGRVIGDRRTQQKNKVVKYCSDGCREHRPGPMDKKIDRTILALLLGHEESGLEKTGAKAKYRKGDHRNVITCDEIEKIAFDRKVETAVPEQVDEGFGSENDDLAGGVDGEENEGEEKSTEESSEAHKADALEKQKAGNKRAKEREMVRRAARRAVVFGFPVEPAAVERPQSRGKGASKADQEATSEEAPRRKCEALMNGHVVEPSYAKGNWSIRWRE